MERFTACFATVAAILGALESGHMRWTPLTRIVVQSSTPWRAQAVLEWLLEKGYLDSSARSVYRITEHGSLLLSALPAPPRRHKEASTL
jgi:predicted transcriptional regulator